MEYKSCKPNQISLIDFGLVKKYLAKNDQPLERVNVKSFEGNVQFSSAQMMDCISTGRRDDLISLLYLTIYLLNGTIHESVRDVIGSKEYLF